ncbi:MAG: hypothetical protein PHI35_02070, partial [Victivallaceae bacterium]|nr:hypothetical protein [Victivallaceae bacterium]
MRRTIIALLTALSFMFAVCQLSSASDDAPEMPPELRRILYIASYSGSYGWSSSVRSGFCSALRDELPREQLSFDVVELDTFENGLLTPSNERISLLRNQLNDERYDLIVCADNPAADLFLDNKLHMPADTPLVFCGYNGTPGDPRLLASGSGTYGILMPDNIFANIQLGLRLLPMTNTVVVITDGGADGISQSRRLNDELRLLRKVNIVQLRGDRMSTEEMLQTLSEMPRDTFAVYANWR